MKALNMEMLAVEPAEGGSAAACACCAGEPGLRGFVYAAGEARAVYFVEPIGAPSYPMVKLGVAVGAWSLDEPPSERECFAFVCRPAAAGPVLSPSEPVMAGFPELETLGRAVSADALPIHIGIADFTRLAMTVIRDDPRLSAIAFRGGEDPAHPAPRRFSAEPS